MLERNLRALRNLRCACLLRREGFSVMITVGGYNMFNVGIELAANLAGAGVHLGSFLLAVAGLAITALFTFFIYNWTFGRKPLEQVHAEKALNSLKELGYDASMVKKLDKEELEGYDAAVESGVPGRHERVGEGLSDRFSYDGCASCVSRTRVAGVRFATRLALRVSSWRAFLVWGSPFF